MDFYKKYWESQFANIDCKRDKALDWGDEGWIDGFVISYMKNDVLTIFGLPFAMFD